MDAVVDRLDVWGRIGRIHLDEMDSIKLMNRIDSKYLTNVVVLEKLLEQAAMHGYRALEVDGAVICPYNSMYYDTESLKMFTDHHNRRLVRQKVRTRVYVQSGITFLEIKHKNNKGRTKKKRVEIPSCDFLDFRGNSEAAAFLSSRSDFTVEMLKPRMETVFRRITLVNRAMTERLTIDTSLRFVNHDTDINAELGPAVIIELKQDGRAYSEMKNILLDLRVKPVRVSKYCIGTTLTNPAAKSSRFRTKVRMIEKITGQKIKIEI
ncbi:MAG: polyphosphate polymerase domain-containing protein [Bacteroidales bacterium]|nr:polyphosphate polymerase domain-containing protein [Bacteroides sp.]MCM1198165.1 polyphosphate polymerase domain-containing protein [Clostridium sp.]MCM1501529.1 polyphosphate polymerase domain-containing protein [Bacteroidales bacterium]